MDADQVIRDSTAPRLRENLLKMAESIAKDAHSSSIFGTSLKLTLDELIEKLGLSYNVQPATFIQAIPADLLLAEYRKLYDKSVKLFAAKCSVGMAEFFQRNPSRPYKKNWIHIQKILIQEKFRSGSLITLAELQRLQSQAKNVKREGNEERPILPHLLDLAIVPISVYAKSDADEVQAYSQQLANLIRASDFNNAELLYEFKRFAISAQVQFKPQTAEGILRVLEGFFDKAGPEPRGQMIDWLSTLAEENNPKDKSRPAFNNDFLYHALARSKIKGAQVVGNAAAGLQLFKFGNEVLPKVSSQKYVFRSYMKAAVNSLDIYADLPIEREYFNHVTSLPLLELQKIMGTEEREALSDYLNAYIDKQKKYAGGAEDQLIALVKKQSGKVKLEDSRSLPEMLERANRMLKAFGIKEISPYNGTH